MSLVIANFCSVYNKEAELVALSYNDIDILLGTESHLDTSIFNSEIFPDFYNIYRKDRNRHGGGVFIMVKDNLPTSEIISESPVKFQLLWLLEQKDANCLDLEILLGFSSCCIL